MGLFYHFLAGGLFNLRWPRLVFLHRRQPVEKPDRRALGSPFDLVA
jgi:hypothetical protein